MIVTHNKNNNSNIELEKELIEILNNTPVDVLIDRSRTMITEKLNTLPIHIAPKRLQKAQLSDFAEWIQTDVRQALATGRGIFIFGKVGCGKSSLAVAILRELYARIAVQKINTAWESREQNGWGQFPSPQEALRYITTSLYNSGAFANFKFKNAAELMDDIKACFAKDSVQDKRTLIEEYAEVEALVLDDLGMEKPTEFVRETFDMIINKRWLDERMTIVTSNLSLPRLEEHYGDEGRISSRIAGMCTIIELIGEDRRIQK